MDPIELPPLPDGFEATRRSLHRVAEDVIKVAREHATGEFPLAQTPGGFGTPEWGGGNQIRVEGTELVVLRDGSEERAPRSRSLAAAARLIGAGLAARGPRAQRRAVDDRPGGGGRAGRRLRRRPAGAGADPRRRRSRRGAHRADPLARAFRPGDRDGRRGSRACGPTTGSHRATRSTPSPTSTSGPGARSRRASCGTRRASPGRSSTTPSWPRRRTRWRRRSSSASSAKRALAGSKDGLRWPCPIWSDRAAAAAAAALDARFI